MCDLQCSKTEFRVLEVDLLLQSTVKSRRSAHRSRFSRDLGQRVMCRIKNMAEECNKLTCGSGLFLSQVEEVPISVFHRAFFNSIIDKHQNMHLTFNSILV